MGTDNPKGQSCGNCNAWYGPTNAMTGQGLCRAKPPQVVVLPMPIAGSNPPVFPTKTFFPEIASVGWCRAWAINAEAPKPN